MSDVVVLALVLLLAASGYAAGRVHGQVGYRGGYRSGYRQGYADGTRSRPRGVVPAPPRRFAGDAPADGDIEVLASGDHEPSDTRQLRPWIRAAVQKVRHGRG